LLCRRERNEEQYEADNDDSAIEPFHIFLFLVRLVCITGNTIGLSDAGVVIHTSNYLKSSLNLVRHRLIMRYPNNR
jgi:hypothetical protein